MILQFNVGWRLNSDGIQWILERQNKNKDSGQWSGRWTKVGWFQDPRRAIVEAFKKDVVSLMGEVPEGDVGDVLCALDSLYRRFDETLKDVRNKVPTNG